MCKDTPQVSIIVPFYNTAAYLAKCLTALIEQTYTHIEILLIDDASTDESLAIAEEFAQKDARIRILNQAATPPLTGKMGVAKARNLGLDAARGKYIMFCDSDDYYEPNMVELMVKAMEENPAADLASCSAKVHQIGWQDKNLEHYFRNEEQGLFDFTQLMRARESVCLWNKIFKKDIFVSYNIAARKPIPYSEDDSVSAKYFSVCAKMFHLRDELYNYILRENSATHTAIKEKHKFVLAILSGLEDIADFFDENNIWIGNTEYFSYKLKNSSNFFPKEYKEEFLPAYKIYIALARRINTDIIITPSLRTDILSAQIGVIKRYLADSQPLRKLNRESECNSVPIVFAVDEDYCRYLTVAIQSIIDNSSNKHQYHIIILEDKCPSEHLALLRRQIAKTENFTIDIISIKETLAPHNDIFAQNHYYPPAVYGRYFIPYICMNFDKIIYAEADMIFNRDLAELINMDLGENYIAATVDLGMNSFYADKNYKSYTKSKLLEDKKQPYCFSGFLVFNAREWREKNIADKCIALVGNELKEDRYADQDAINIVCKDKIIYLDQSWNCCPFIEKMLMGTWEMQLLLASDGFMEKNSLSL